MGTATVSHVKNSGASRFIVLCAELLITPSKIQRHPLTMLDVAIVISQPLKLLKTKRRIKIVGNFIGLS